MVPLLTIQMFLFIQFRCSSSYNSIVPLLTIQMFLFIQFKCSSSYNSNVPLHTIQMFLFIQFNSSSSYNSNVPLHTIQIRHFNYVHLQIQHYSTPYQCMRYFTFMLSHRKYLCEYICYKQNT